MRTQFVFLAALCAFVGAGRSATAGVIVEDLGPGQVSNNAATAIGQAFMTPTGGPWDNITFNFFANQDGTTPSAVGDLFLLTQQYNGTPGGLSSSTAGFVAESTTISGGEYVFASSVELQPSTLYYAYTDSLFSSHTVWIESNGNLGSLYVQFSESTTQDYSTPFGGGTAMLAVYGTAVPEPSTLVQGISAIVICLGAAQLRRQRTCAV